MSDQNPNPSEPVARHASTQFVWRGFLVVLFGCGFLLLGLYPNSGHREGIAAAGVFLVVIAPVLLFLTSGIGSRMFGWIRRMLTLRRAVFGIACMATLIAAFYTVENWRGKRAWEIYKAGMEAKSRSLDPASLQPAKVPDAQNFYKTPLLQRIGYKTLPEMRESRPVRMSDEDTALLSKLSNVSQASAYFPDVSSGKTADLKAIQEFIRAHLPDKPKYGSKPPVFTNLPPVAGSPAQDIFAALTEVKPAIDELREAARRPFAQVEPYETFDGPIPHFVALRGIAQNFALHALAELADGNSADAFDDARVLQKVCESVRHNPVLVSSMIAVAIEGLHTGIFWQGWAKRQWTDEQLRAFQSYFESANLVSWIDTGLTGEAVIFGAMWTDFSREKLSKLLNFREPRNFGERIETAFSKACVEAIPRGWLYQNRLSHNRLLFEMMSDYDTNVPCVYPARVADRMKQLEKYFARWVTPYNLFTRIAIPNCGRAIRTTCFNQAYANMAAIACALERYRHASGSYPDSLDQLQPAFMVKVPRDPVNGAPMHYRHSDNRKFLLYSTGWNERDDGGEPADASIKDWQQRLESNDWVWRFPQE